MKIVVQRVKKAQVAVEEDVVGSIDRGLLVLVGVYPEDTEEIAKAFAEKIVNLRIFPDEKGKMGLSVADIEGEVLLVSQFTLCASCDKGRRPDFTGAANPDYAKHLYEKMAQHFQTLLGQVETGEFGGAMEVSLVNEGPVTLILE